MYGIRFQILTLLLGFFLPLFGVAEDSSVQLKAIGACADAKNLAAQNYALWDAARKEIEEAAEEIHNNGNLGRIAKKLGSAVVKNRVVNLNAGMLIQMGEPCGIDLRLRSETLLNRLTGIKESDFGKKLWQPARKIHLSNTGRIRGAMQKIQKNFDSGKFDKAEKQLDDLMDSVHGFGFFLETKYQSELYSPIAQIEATVRGKMGEVRRAKWKETLTAQYQKNLPDMDALTGRVDSIVSDIQESGSTAIGNKDVSGPDAFRTVFNAFHSTHLKLIRAKGFAIAMRDADLIKQSDALLKQVKDQLVASLPKVIEADAKRLSGSEVKAVYYEYLRKILPLARKTEGELLIDACAEAMKNLAGKDQSFALEIAAYRDATSDLLRWRKKTASSTAQSRIREYADAAKVVNSRMGMEEQIKFAGLETVSQIGVPSKLYCGLNEIYPASRDRLKEMKVSLTDPTDFGKSWFKSISDRYWVKVNQSVDLKSAVDSLRTDLMASTDLPPLTLSSAMSLATATGNHHRTIGGQITDTKLESLARRLATIPDKGAVLVPIGNQQIAPDLDQLLVQLEVAADWIQHDHFFVDLGSN